MAAWAGLGYYARARNLLACARAVAGAGTAACFPDTEAALAGHCRASAPIPQPPSRPSPSTAPTNVVDGNVEQGDGASCSRSRGPCRRAKPELKALAAKLGRPIIAPASWAQALMDLGATICRPRAPLLCERRTAVRLLRRPAPAARRRPIRGAKRAKAERPRRHGAAFLLLRGDQVGLIRRPPRGLLGWHAGPAQHRVAGEAVCTMTSKPPRPPPATGARMGEITTMSSLTSPSPCRSGAGQDADTPDDRLIWTPRERLDALPTVFLKAVRVGLLSPIAPPLGKPPAKTTEGTEGLSPPP